MKELERVFCTDASALHKWLSNNHKRSESVWLVKWKKGAADDYMSYEEMVDELLCYGWIDSLPRKLDDKRTMIRISPRSLKSNWSGSNKQRVQRLISEGRMQAAGLRMIEEAKQRGTWDFLDDVEKGIIPPDLGQSFDALKGSREYFERFPDSSKRAILEWIKSAKTEATRSKRITETVQKAAQNIKANHPKGKDAGPPLV